MLEEIHGDDYWNLVYIKGRIWPARSEKMK